MCPNQPVPVKSFLTTSPSKYKTQVTCMAVHANFLMIPRCITSHSRSQCATCIHHSTSPLKHFCCSNCKPAAHVPFPMSTHTNCYSSYGMQCAPMVHHPAWFLHECAHLLEPQCGLHRWSVSHLLGQSPAGLRGLLLCGHRCLDLLRAQWLPLLDGGEPSAIAREG